MYPTLGILLGAVIAPVLTKQLGVAIPSLENYIYIGIALVVGAIVEIAEVVSDYIGEELLRVGLYLVRERFTAGSFRLKLGTVASFLGAGIPAGIAMTIVLGSIFLYIELSVKNLNQVAWTFVVALLIKTFLIPLIKTAVLGAGVKAFWRYVRRDSTKPPDKG